MYELFDIIASLSLCTMYHVSVVLSEEMNLEDEIGKCWVRILLFFPVACLFITTSGSSLSPGSTPVSLTLLNEDQIRPDMRQGKKNCKEEYNNEEK